MLKRPLRRSFTRVEGGRLVVLHALLERLDALGDVAHKVGDFVAADLGREDLHGLDGQLGDSQHYALAQGRVERTAQGLG